MSKDESSGGFLSKVVKFVRHPATDWAALEADTTGNEADYTKSELKALIARKQRNDFVRKREFDSLRKILPSEVTGEDHRSVKRSLFQSSLSSNADDRAMTLRKIDEIEVQMSNQWSKTLGPESLPRGDLAKIKSRTLHARAQSRQNPDPLAKGAPEQPKPQRHDQQSPSDSRARGAVAEPFAPTQLAFSKPRLPTLSSQAGTKKPQPSADSEPSFARTGLMVYSDQTEVKRPQPIFSATHFYELEVHEVVQDPQVEEAAIRFANGDDAGAEQGLLDTLGERGAQAQRQEDWLALLDLYRATGQLAPFESYAMEFANRFNRTAPQWFDMPEMVGKLSGHLIKPSVTPDLATWACDRVMDAHAVGTLQKVLLQASLPWTLDWSRVESIEVKAARALLGVFTLWTEQNVALRFRGADALRDLLKKITPSGRRDVEQIWWELRLAALRVMNRPDEFELTALDFCVTYEVSPPDWEKPLCHFQEASSADSAEINPSVLGQVVLERAPQAPTGYSDVQGPASELNNLGLVELSGEIRGDPEAILAALEQRLEGSDVLIISCRNLIRVDFAAAGALLNWVSGHHSQGREVQFVDVHRLVSAFFHVIGITENAKVVLSND